MLVSGEMMVIGHVHVLMGIMIMEVLVVYYVTILVFYVVKEELMDVLHVLMKIQLLEELLLMDPVVVLLGIIILIRMSHAKNAFTHV
jgi:hypothetical protein